MGPEHQADVAHGVGAAKAVLQRAGAHAAVAGDAGQVQHDAGRGLPGEQRVAVLPAGGPVAGAPVDAVVARFGIEVVAVTATQQGVVARAAREAVTSNAALQQVGAVVARQRGALCIGGQVDGGRACRGLQVFDVEGRHIGDRRIDRQLDGVVVEGAVVGALGHHVRQRVDHEAVAARAAHQGVHTRATVQGVVAFSPADVVSACVAEQQVVAARATHAVVAVQALQHVVVAVAHQGVVEGRAAEVLDASQRVGVGATGGPVGAQVRVDAGRLGVEADEVGSAGAVEVVTALAGDQVVVLVAAP